MRRFLAWPVWVVILLGCLASPANAKRVALWVDPKFQPKVTTSRETWLTAIAQQADGRLLVGGRFDLVDGLPYNNVVRLREDGAVDDTFRIPYGVHGHVEALAVQADGRILLAGQFDRVNGVERRGLARLWPDGSLDDAFAPRLQGPEDFEVRALALQPDGRIVIGGNFDQVNQQLRRGIACLKLDGSVDETFDPGEGIEDNFGLVDDLACVGGGRVVAVGIFTKVNQESRPGLVRFEANGALDPEFLPRVDWSVGLPQVLRVRALPHGRLLIAGRFDWVNETPRPTLARLEANGELDPSFDASAVFPDPADGPVMDVLPLPDGGILVAGRFEHAGDELRRGLVRLGPTGEIDAVFATGDGFQRDDGTPGRVQAIFRQPDGGIVVAGEFGRINGQPRQHLARLEASGALDPQFSRGGIRIERGGVVNTILRLPEGRMLIGGQFERVNNVARAGLARLTAQGALDPSFDARLDPTGLVNMVAAQPDGRIVVAGRFRRLDGLEGANLIRVDPDGRPDPSFAINDGPNGEVYCVAVRSDGHIVFGGDFDLVSGAIRGRIGQVDPWGHVDEGFTPWLDRTNDTPEVYTIIVQEEGLLIGGYFDHVNGEERANVARLAFDGSLDPRFDASLAIDGALPLVVSLALQQDGRIVLGGTFDVVNGAERHGVARLYPNGGLDASFDPGAGLSGGELPAVNSIGVLPDGGILIGGEFTSVNEAPLPNLARLRTDGSVDTSFASSVGADSWVNTLVVDDDGTVLIGGAFTWLNGFPRQAIARLRATEVPAGTLTLRLGNPGLTLDWPEQGTLQYADSIRGPWTDLADARPPYVVAPEQRSGFFRTRYPLPDP